MDTNLYLLSRRQLRELAARIEDRATYYAGVADAAARDRLVYTEAHARQEADRSAAYAAELNAFAQRRRRFSHVPALLGLSKVAPWRA